jgi:hypothetical protein
MPDIAASTPAFAMCIPHKGARLCCDQALCEGSLHSSRSASRQTKSSTNDCKSDGLEKMREVVLERKLVRGRASIGQSSPSTPEHLLLQLTLHREGVLREQWRTPDFFIVVFTHDAEDIET